MKAQAVAQAMARGLQRVSPQFDLIMYPLASGGAGTTDLAVRHGRGRVRHETIPVLNHRPRDVKWALFPDGTAMFDARDAMGTPDGPTQLSQTYSDSRPLGEMLMRLIARRPSRIVVAVADVLAADGGMGLLRAFGVRGCDQQGGYLSSGTRDLLKLDHIDFSQLTPPNIPILALMDKSVSFNERVKQDDFRLDLIHGGLAAASGRVTDLLGEHVRVSLGETRGTGVGGGMGLALAFLGAQFVSGAQYLTELGNFLEHLWHVDWILTGSSALTQSSAMQAVGLAATAARDAGIPAVALTVEMGSGHFSLYDAGLVGMYSVLERPRTVNEVHRGLAALVEKAAYRVGVWMQALSDP